MSKTMLLGDRDKRVYQWEWEHVDRHDRSFSNGAAETQAVVDHVWREMGLIHPPKVVVNPSLNSRSGLGNRMKLEIGERVALSTVLHELAHSMDVSLEVSAGVSALRPETEVSGSYHDDNWLGLYVKMLDRFIGGRHFNLFWLYKSLQDSGLTYSLAPRPRCI